MLDTLFDGAYANGHLLTMREGTLLAYPFDERSARITGDPISVADRLSGSSDLAHGVFGVHDGVLAVSRALHDLEPNQLVFADGKESNAAHSAGEHHQFQDVAR